MKRLIFSLTLAVSCIAASAQQYIVVNGEPPILASDVEKITYEVDDQFDQILLPGALALDPKTTIFSAALQLTGLVDTLKTYLYAHSDPLDEQKIFFRSNTITRTTWPFYRRFKNYTVFVETDEAFAEQGITNLEQLMAYAKLVYDEFFPEDAGITDPKDRRNSLNRFVAYHILKHGSTYWYLTAYDNIIDGSFFQNTDLADIAAWYGTLLPHASLKCSYPMAGEESGLYLNRRGLKDGPDKYGKQVRGAMVIADGEKGFDHECFNGCYFHIDRVLTYDQTTRDEVLGSELWRVDFKTLTPEIMSCAKDLRGDYDHYDGWEDPIIEGPNTETGCNYYYRWDRMENIVGDTAKSSIGLVACRIHQYYWSWQGDEAYIFGDFDMTIKLPALPAGEWEVRMGATPFTNRPNVRVYLNGRMTVDSLDMSKDYDETIPYMMRGARECCVYQKESIVNVPGMVRYRLGRIETDGKSDNYLRIEMLPGELGNDYMTQFDYFELVPKAVFDNQEIPEE